MITKLTLTIDASIIAMSKQYAKEKGQSLSQLVENYLKSLPLVTSKNYQIDPTVRKLRGVIKLPKEFDYKKELGKSISNKYKK